MSRFAVMALMAAGALLATAAEADQKSNKGSHRQENCPPGLAKKNPPCIPPGQVNRSNDGETRPILPSLAPQPSPMISVLALVGLGDVLDGDYVVLVNPQVYNPDIDGLYVRFGSYLYFVGRDRAEVLDQLGPVSGWNWAWADTDFANCPPGLAKKDPPCVPPGQARKGTTVHPIPNPAGVFDPYGLGDILPDGHATVIDPRLFAPNTGAAFVRSGDTLYRIDRLTGQVLDVIGDLLNLLR